jgi:hypothetical protein
MLVNKLSSKECPGKSHCIVYHARPDVGGVGKETGKMVWLVWGGVRLSAVRVRRRRNSDAVQRIVSDQRMVPKWIKLDSFQFVANCLYFVYKYIYC